jgi:hypothetical protein
MFRFWLNHHQGACSLCFAKLLCWYQLIYWVIKIVQSCGCMLSQSCLCVYRCTVQNETVKCKDSFEMYFICFAFILCAVALEIYFRNQLVFLQASRNETPIDNSVPMGSKKWHDSSLCDQHLRNNYVTGTGVTCILTKTNT